MEYTRTTTAFPPDFRGLGIFAQFDLGKIKITKTENRLREEIKKVGEKKRQAKRGRAISFEKNKKGGMGGRRGHFDEVAFAEKQARLTS
jgi:hypothetical protein